jgi:hypothetical protein
MNLFRALITTALISSCSSPKNLNLVRKLRPTEVPLSLLDFKQTIDKKFNLTFELDYHQASKSDQEKMLLSAKAQALKTIYLMGYTQSTLDVSDLRSAKCSSFKLKNEELECGNNHPEIEWNKDDKNVTLPQFYWSRRFQERYLEDLADKPGVFISFVKNYESDLELLSVSSKEDVHFINFKFARIATSPKTTFPVFKLIILEQKSPYLEISLLKPYLATKKTDGYLAPVTSVSRSFENLKKKKFIIFSHDQKEAYLKNIQKLYQELGLSQDSFNACPIVLEKCDFPSHVNFSDERDLERYLYDRGLRQHIFGLLLLAHTQFKLKQVSKDKTILSFEIDMKTILRNYKFKSKKAFLEVFH